MKPPDNQDGFYVNKKKMPMLSYISGSKAQAKKKVRGTKIYI